ncbi:transposase family protein [Saccharopolyspora mangrovi]|uniref:transposase family protein n=1 Tax=Saccharopolyspora mangrovi TaxID=3082379 RepID=UPI00389AD557
MMTDCGYKCNTAVIMTYCKRSDGQPLPDWQEELNATNRRIRARVEHALAEMKCWKILATNSAQPALWPPPPPAAPSPQPSSPKDPTPQPKEQLPACCGR